VKEEQDYDEGIMHFKPFTMEGGEHSLDWEFFVPEGVWGGEFGEEYIARVSVQLYVDHGEHGYAIQSSYSAQMTWW